MDQGRVIKRNTVTTGNETKTSYGNTINAFGEIEAWKPEIIFKTVTGNFSKFRRHSGKFERKTRMLEAPKRTLESTSRALEKMTN